MAFSSHPSGLSLDMFLVGPQVTDTQLAAARAALEPGYQSITVTPARLTTTDDITQRVVIGFPWGGDDPLTKSFAARFAIDRGAAEILLVPDLAAVAARAWSELLTELVTVREAAPSPVQMSVLWNCRSEVAELERCCQIAMAAGMDGVTLGALTDDGHWDAVDVAGAHQEHVAAAVNAAQQAGAQVECVAQADSVQAESATNTASAAGVSRLALLG